MVKTLAFFDLDHTLLKVNSSFHFGKYLYQKRLIPTYSIVLLILYYGLHKMGFLSIDSLHRCSFKTFFKNKKKSHYQSLANEFADLYFDQMVFLEISKILKNFQDNGCYTAVLSSSPDFLVEAFAKKFQTNAYQGTSYQSDENGLFKNILTICDASKKIEYVLKKSMELSIPLTDCFAYSDSELDIPFLKCVGHPFAVNPSKTLRQYSKLKDWKILDP